MTLEQLTARLLEGETVWVPVQTGDQRAVFVPQPRQIVHVGTDTVHLANHPDTLHLFCY